MSLIPVDHHGVHVLGPEEFFCAILRWPEEGRILPIWMSAIEGGYLAAYELDESPRRPGTHDLLADALSRQEGGVSQIAITSYYEGVFVATITAGGEDMDARASDALILATILDLQVYVDEDVLTQASIWVQDEALEEYLGLSFGDDVTPAADQRRAPGGEGAISDAEFESMMRSLGMTDVNKETDDTPGIKDDNDEV